MQIATDSAALAAAMEITNALRTAGTDVSNVFDYALAQARTTGSSVAEMNGIYVDPNADVIFGRRSYNEQTQTFTTEWNVPNDQVNVVKVVARRTESDKTQPDGKLPGIFSSAFGFDGFSLVTESIAFIDPRDIVVVHDFSRSMNYDSYYTDSPSLKLSEAQIHSNLQLVWNDLQPLNVGTMTFEPQYAWKTQSTSGASATVTFKGASASITTNTKIKTVVLSFSSGSQTFSISNNTTTSGTWAGTGSNSGKLITGVTVTIRRVGSTSYNWTLSQHQYNSSTIKACFGLNSVSYPFASGSWDDYIDFVQDDEGLEYYNKLHLYGGTTFLSYLMRHKSSFNECNQLWKTRHYPFHAIKQGHQLLCDYLIELGFNDHLGMVSYDSSHRWETELSESGMPSVDISSQPISNDFTALNNLMKYKQASHYSDSTNMAGGMKDAIAMLDAHKRPGTRPAILLMTDGNGNVLDSGESGNLPSDWSWSELFDYDGDGDADFTTSNTHAKVALKYVQQAVAKGYTVHAISVGADADTETLKAVAWLGNGHYIHVPGGTDVTQMEETVKAAFAKIAAAVPPARLMAPSE
jgi:hypothetical protein